MIPTIPTPLTRLGLNILGLLGVIVALRWGATVFIPTVIALLLAAVLGPGAVWVNSTLRVRWSLACVTVIFLLIMLNLLIIVVFARSVTRMLQVLPRPDDEPRILNLYNNWHKQLEDHFPFQLDPTLFPANPTSVSEIPVFQRFFEFVDKNWVEAFRVVTVYTGSWLWQWILILFILLFLLLEGRMLTRRTIEIFGPSEEVRAKAGAVLADIARHVRTYLVWRTIINFGLAVVVGLVFQIWGLSQAWMWAILLALLNYVPYLGPIVAGVPPVIDAFLSVSPMGALGILIFYIGVIIVEGYLIVPLLMGRSMDLNATTVMLACLFWDLIWGTLGLFLAMPLMAALRAVCYHVPGWRPWANLMGTSEEEPRPVFLDPAAAPAATVETEKQESAA